MPDENVCQFMECRASLTTSFDALMTSVEGDRAVDSRVLSSVKTD